MAVKKIIPEEALPDETDYVFLCSVLDDIDISDEYPLYKSDDKLVLWLTNEIRERVFLV